MCVCTSHSVFSCLLVSFPLFSSLLFIHSPSFLASLCTCLLFSPHLTSLTFLFLSFLLFLSSLLFLFHFPTFFLSVFLCFLFSLPSLSFPFSFYHPFLSSSVHSLSFARLPYRYLLSLFSCLSLILFPQLLSLPSLVSFLSFYIFFPSSLLFRFPFRHFFTCAISLFSGYSCFFFLHLCHFLFFSFLLSSDFLLFPFLFCSG